VVESFFASPQKEPAIRRYLEILESTFMIRLLPPYIANLKKRQVKPLNTPQPKNTR
jgi:predicted AAA+ superfamily ATPase